MAERKKDRCGVSACSASPLFVCLRKAEKDKTRPPKKEALNKLVKRAAKTRWRIGVKNAHSG